MELSRFDLTTAVLALRVMIQAHHCTIDEKVLQSTERAIADILIEYPNNSVFLVQPDLLEGNDSVFSVQTNMLEE